MPDSQELLSTNKKNDPYKGCSIKDGCEHKDRCS